MYGQLTVAVVIPAFNEEGAILRSIDAVPSFVDDIIVVDDASHDATAVLAARRGVEIIHHRENRGVGAAIVSGYRHALARGRDVAVVMAGDGQMDPADLPALLEPLAQGRADYCKGNRFLDRRVWRTMPRSRIVGNLMLSTATKVTSGYWRVFDSQCGYTAITRAALERIDLAHVFPRYGYPNDLLARLHIAGMRVCDVPVRPVYGEGWKSGIKLGTVINPVAMVLLRSWAMRLSAEASAGAPALPESSG